MFYNNPYITVMMVLFIVFITIAVVCSLVTNWIVLYKLKQQFWNSFYILKLLPKDDIDKEFIKRINDLLVKA